MWTKLILAITLFQPVRALAQPADSQNLARKLQTTVEDYSLTEESFPQALLKFAAEFEIPMGIEWVRESSAFKRVALVWHRATVRELLETLVRGQLGYEWEIKNGVVHVFPYGSLTDKRSFMNLVIDRFEIREDYVRFASNRFRDRIRQIVNPPQPPSTQAQVKSGSGGSMATGLGDQRVSFKLENVTVRDALDKLSLAADLKVWLVTYAAGAELTRTGFRRTIFSIHDDYIPDEEQPVWQLLLWGYDPILGGLRKDWKFRTPSLKSNN